MPVAATQQPQAKTHEFWEPTPGQEAARKIAALAVWTGVATVNRQQWIAGVDYGGAVDLTFLDSKFLAYFASSMIAASREYPFIDLGILTTLGALSSSLVAWGHLDFPLLTGRNVSEFAKSLASSPIGGYPLTKALVKSLESISDHDFSSVRKVRKTLSDAVALLLFLDKSTATWPSALKALLTDDHTEVGDTIQQEGFSPKTLELLPAFHGSFFCFDFLRLFGRSLDVGQYDLASDFLVKNQTVFIVIERNGDGDEDVVVEGSLAEFEDFVDEAISQDKRLQFGDFQAEASNGTGSFECMAFMGEGERETGDWELLQILAVAQDFKVSQLTVVRFV
ncbi:hypothetical protein BDR26DRAFT_1009776 [Obelidium mucronatum]|nr:hypothetical protein BDR26DRAFT_1009776 [Obelidium mucronatum]